MDIQNAVKKILVGSAGSLQIELPIIEIGSGDPKILILAGLHGDEFTSLFVIHRLLKEIDLLKGTLRIIPTSDPLGLVLKQREEPLGRKDPNRAFPGDAKEDFTFRLAAKLFEIAKESPECVIDLHTLGMHSRLMCIFMNHGTRSVREKSLKLINLFCPELVWQLDTRSNLGKNWGGSMGPAMAGEGIVNFAVEMAEHDHVTADEIEQVVSGILRILNYFGMVTTAPALPSRQPLIFGYRAATSDETGLFEPDSSLLDAVLGGNFLQIAQGQIIGHLVHPITFATNPIISQYSGPLVAIQGRSFVRTGDDLYNVGEVKPWTMLAETTIGMITKYAIAMQPDQKERLIKATEMVVTLALEKNADSSICRAAIWLSSLDNERDFNLHLADSWMRALPDIHDDTRERILACLSSQSDDLSLEARIVNQVLNNV